MVNSSTATCGTPSYMRMFCVKYAPFEPSLVTNLAPISVRPEIVCGYLPCLASLADALLASDATG